jgi:hypothetical protein
MVPKATLFKYMEYVAPVKGIPAKQDPVTTKKFQELAATGYMYGIISGSPLIDKSNQALVLS